MTEYQRLSKIATLRLAIQYIRAMNRILGRTTNLCPESTGLREHKHLEQSFNGCMDGTAQQKWTGNLLDLNFMRDSHVDSTCDCVEGEPTKEFDIREKNRRENWFDFESAEQKTLVLFGYTSDLGWDTASESHFISSEKSEL